MSTRSQVDRYRSRPDPRGTIRVHVSIRAAAVHLDRPEPLSHTEVMASSTADGISGGDEQPATSPGLIQMSFPAILRAPKLADRFAHLRLTSASEDSTCDSARLVIKKNKREDREGKRWVRRKENCTIHWLNAVVQEAH